MSSPNIMVQKNCSEKDPKMVPKKSNGPMVQGSNGPVHILSYAIWKWIYVLTQNLPSNNSFSTSLYLNVIFTGLWNLHNVARPRLKSESLVLSRIASEDRGVIDSKAYFVAFQTLMFIIFQGKYSIAFLLFILLTRRSNMIEKERKIWRENIESRPCGRNILLFDHFLWTYKMMPY